MCHTETNVLRLIGRGARVAMDIACGLVFLHSKSIVHLDIQSPNILLNRYGLAKIADVGLARIRQNTYCSVMDNSVGECVDSTQKVQKESRHAVKEPVFKQQITSTLLSVCRRFAGW